MNYMILLRVGGTLVDVLTADTTYNAHSFRRLKDLLTTTERLPIEIHDP